MSACEGCLRRSFMRAEVAALLEKSGAGLAAARRALESEPDELSFELESRGRSDCAVEEAIEALVAREDIWRLCGHDPEFPAGLTAFERESDIPIVIYGAGEKRHLDELREPGGLAIVGARRASAYGREVAYALAGDATARGLTLVSGMALGIDGAAHRGALQAGGPTIAVLAGGPDAAYPRSHRLLYEQILGAGCAISENPPGVEARRWAFIARNRIIAGISRMVVFAEGSADSGARHTVSFARDLDLPVGAVPGPITSPMSAGPNGLLGEPGIVAVRGIADVADELALERFEFPAAGPAAPGTLPDRVLELIAAGERTPRSLAAALDQHDRREISRALGELELRGRIKRGRGGEYERLP